MGCPTYPFGVFAPWRRAATLALAMPTFDDEGYLVDPDDWNDALAQQIAQGLGVELTDDHWFVLRFMRDRYHENRVTVDARHVMRHIAREESELLPMAARLLSDDALQDIGRAMRLRRGITTV